MRDIFATFDRVLAFLQESEKRSLLLDVTPDRLTDEPRPRPILTLAEQIECVKRLRIEARGNNGCLAHVFNVYIEYMSCKITLGAESARSTCPDSWPACRASSRDIRPAGGCPRRVSPVRPRSDRPSRRRYCPRAGPAAGRR